VVSTWHKFISKKGDWRKVDVETDLSNLSLTWRKHGMHPGASFCPTPCYATAKWDFWAFSGTEREQVRVDVK